MYQVSPLTTPGAFVAHRGASLEAPENTIAAFKLAADQGFEWLEIDVQLTKDNIPVVIHDSTLDRTTDGSGYVANIDFNELRNLDASKAYPGHEATHIPTLTETLDFILSRDLGLVLEIKPVPGRDIEHAVVVCDILARIWPQSNNKLIVSSFSTLTLEVLKAALPWVSIALATEILPNDPQAYVDRLGICGIHTQLETVRMHDLQATLATGIHVAVATLNDASKVDEFFKIGVHSIMTDTANLFANAVK